MSYNIDSIDIVASEGFAIPKPLLLALLAEHAESHFPESSILTESWVNSCEDFRGMLFPKRVHWCGEGSGSTLEIFKKCLAKFFGRVDLILTWEGGDSHSGLRLLNGKVTEHEVVMALGKEKKQ